MMRVRFKRRASDGTLAEFYNVTEIHKTRQRIDAYAFIDAHPDLVIVAESNGSWWVWHAVHGSYVGSAQLEFLLELFGVVDYLAWVSNKVADVVAGSNE